MGYGGKTFFKTGENISMMMKRNLYQGWDSSFISSRLIQRQIKMIGYIKKQHTAIFIGQTGCGKTRLDLELIEKECSKHFDYIIIICPTLRETNKTCHAKEWIKNDDNVWLVDPKDNLYQWIKKLSELLRFLEVLFITDDIIADESLDKRRQPLLELTISGRHQSHYLWLLT